MFNRSKKIKEKKTAANDLTKCYLRGEIEVVLFSVEGTPGKEGPLFKVTHEEAGIAWTVDMSQLAQLLVYSHDENDKPLLDPSGEFRLEVGEEPAIFRGLFPLEIIIMQILGLSVSVQSDAHPYGRCPLMADLYITIRHASEIPDVGDYKELRVVLNEADAA
ncbi:MAG TPA: hypothetical protein V6C97_21075 [Oculatellaceae cyanobacterium]